MWLLLVLNLGIGLLYSTEEIQTGLLIGRGKKAKFCGIFRSKFAKNQLISQDFRGKKVKIRGKIGRFHVIFAGEKSKVAKK